jgi:hypothetical protein
MHVLDVNVRLSEVVVLDFLTCEVLAPQIDCRGVCHVTSTLEASFRDFVYIYFSTSNKLLSLNDFLPVNTSSRFPPIALKLIPL